ncbi:WD40 repeat-like protein [Hesseltinella vesiculosa]|uniref:WD40 repeat-like protein n=1 Tax=Hesseltinella vesiculosa TaxID=101127 RepID=A0A1X2GBQ5_9FUNG|nr:WD40 repeat-like protein [Hesseltinella vesiculosa]
MMPAPSSRFLEILDNIRNEFEQLNQEAYACKSQRDELEHKMNAQIQEMTAFQQNLTELERTQQSLKKHYEEEIAHLRQQLEHAQSRTGSAPAVATPTTPLSSNPLNISHHSTPPTISPGSNYFGSVISNPGQTSHGLAAPPHMADHPAAPPPGPHGSVPPPGPHGSVPPPIAAAGLPSPYGAPPPPAYASGSPSSAHGPPSGYPYAPLARGSSTPTSISSADVKRKSSGPPSAQPYPANRAPAASKSPIVSNALADIDPEMVPSNMKIEGQDWFVLFNPKSSRQLNVNLVQTLDHTSVVCCVKFSQDGRYLATGCNRVTYIYEVMSGKPVCMLRDENAGKDGDLYIRSVCFSPDGKYLATGAEDKMIRIWDIEKQRIRFKLTGHEQDIYSLDFSRDGRIVVSGSGDRTARIWSMADGKLLHKLEIIDNEQKDPGVTSVAISPDCRLVAAGSLDKMVRVWDAYDGRLLDKLEGHKDSVYSVAFMPDGAMLVSGSLDKTLKLWQLGNNKDRDTRNHCKVTFSGHKDFVLSVACTPDGKWVVSGSKDRGVQFWDPRTGQTQFMLQGHKNSVISVAVSPTGRPLFATGSGDNRARIWSYDPL